MLRSILLPVLLLLATLVKAQPVLVGDANPGPDSSAPQSMVAFDGHLYFTAWDATHGRELWRYDGNNPPQMVTDLWPGAGSGLPDARLTIAAAGGGQLFVMAKSSADSFYWNLFVLNSGSSTLSQVALPGFRFEPQINNLAFAGGRLWTRAMPAGDGVIGIDGRLFWYDPVTGQHGIYQPDSLDRPRFLTAVGDDLYLGGRTSDMAWFATGNLLKLNTTTGARTTIVVPHDIYDDTAAGSIPSDLLWQDGQLYFLANYAPSAYNERHLFSYDGTTVTNQQPWLDFDGGSDYLHGIGVRGSDAYGWAYGGPGKLTLIIHHLNMTTADMLQNTFEMVGSEHLDFVSYASALYFGARTPTHGFELWRVDGNGIGLAYDINPGPGSSSVRNFLEWNGSLYFSANDGQHGDELMRLDVTTGVVSNVFFDGSAQVAPNPAGSDAAWMLRLNKAADLALSLYDATGKRVWEKPVSRFPKGVSRIPLAMEGWTPGIYRFAVTDPSGRTLCNGSLSKR